VSFEIKMLHPGFDLDVQVLSGLPVTSPPHRVAPVRFARAVRGPANASAPDIDDRGFTICAGGPAHGPTVGVTLGSTIHVRVVRDRIDKAAPLFATLPPNQRVVSIELPAAGQSITATDVELSLDVDPPPMPEECVALRGRGIGTTTLSVRHGSETGPVLAELAVRVYGLIVIPVAFHRTSVNGVAPRFTRAEIDATFAGINAIYAQAGVRFDVARVVDDSVILDRTGSTLPNDAVNILSHQEFRIVLNRAVVQDMLNVHAVPKIAGGFEGAGNNRGINADTQPGLVFNADPAAAPLRVATVAHELGHVLDLEHYGLGEEGKTIADGGTGEPGNVREDIWAHRNLMYNANSLGAPSRFERFPPGNRFKSSVPRCIIGYGQLKTATPCGSLLGTKQRAAIPQSDQITGLRAAAVGGVFKPTP